MSKALETRNVIMYCFGNDVLKNLLPHLLEQLEVCQKALSGYLDQKRSTFPRFYFVSDAVLLEVLSQGSNPEAIQPHLASVFDSIDSIAFDKHEANKVVSFKAAVGEGLTLHNAVKAEGNIEDWLGALQSSIHRRMSRSRAGWPGSLTVSASASSPPPGCFRGGSSDTHTCRLGRIGNAGASLPPFSLPPFCASAEV